MEIRIVAATSVSPRSPVDVHIGAAFEKGSTDNITAVVVELPSAAIKERALAEAARATGEAEPEYGGMGVAPESFVVTPAAARSEPEAAE